MKTTKENDPIGNLTIEVEQETDGRWIADILALPGVTVYGKSQEDAVQSVKALALRVLADRIEHGEEIPEGLHIFAVAA